MGKAKTVNEKEKIILFKTFQYFEKIVNGEVKKFSAKETKYQLISRLSNLSGYSKGTLYKIIDAGISSSNPSDAFPTKPRKPPQKRVKFDDKQMEAIREIVYSFHKTEGRLVTIEALRCKLEEDLNVHLSTFSLRSVLKELGFRFVQSKDNRVQLVEKPDIVAKRRSFLQKITHFRAEGRSIVYLDETYIHTNYSSSRSWIDDSTKGFRKKIGTGQRYIVGTYITLINKSFCGSCYQKVPARSIFCDELNSANSCT